MFSSICLTACNSAFRASKLPAIFKSAWRVLILSIVKQEISSLSTIYSCTLCNVVSGHLITCVWQTVLPTYRRVLHIIEWNSRPLERGTGLCERTSEYAETAAAYVFCLHTFLRCLLPSGTARVIGSCQSIDHSDRAIRRRDPLMQISLLVTDAPRPSLPRPTNAACLAFIAIPSGTYTITVVANGFASFHRDHVVVAAGHLTVVTAILKISVQ